MNCKPGDLAVIIALGSPNYGRFVTVKELYDGRPSATGRPYASDGQLSWIVEGRGSLVIPFGRLAGTLVPWHVVNDRDLRPIRDNDGEDETLIWVGKPVEEAV